MSHDRFRLRSRGLLLALAGLWPLWIGVIAPAVARGSVARTGDIPPLPTATEMITATPTATVTTTTTNTPPATLAGTPTTTPVSTPTATATSTLTPGTPRQVLLPVIRADVGAKAEWKPVGDTPQGVTLFYEVAVCQQHALAAGNKGLYAANDVTSQSVSWQRQDDGGLAAEQVVSGVMFVPDSDCKTAYAASRATGVWHGRRNGDDWTWSAITPAGTGLTGAYVVLVSGNKLYVAGSFGIAHTSPLPEPGGIPAWLTARNITTATFGLSVSARDATIVHAAVFNRGVFDQAPSDEQQWNPLPGPAIPNALVYDAAANANGTIVAGYDLGLLRWSQSAWSIPQTAGTGTSFTVLAVGPRFYAAQEGRGVLLSVDDGRSWLPIGNKLPATAGFFVRGLSLSDDGRLYAATSAGIWVWSQMP